MVWTALVELPRLNYTYLEISWASILKDFTVQTQHFASTSFPILPTVMDKPLLSLWRSSLQFICGIYSNFHSSSRISAWLQVVAVATSGSRSKLHACLGFLWWWLSMSSSKMHAWYPRRTEITIGFTASLDSGLLGQFNLICDNQKPVSLKDVFNVYTYVVYIKLPFLK